MKRDRFEDIIEGIYEAAAEPQLWSPALSRIAEVTRATVVSLPLFESLRAPVIGAVNLDDNFTAEYPNYAHLNPYFIRGTHLFSEGNAIAGEMIVPAREFLETAYYNEFLRRFDHCYHLGGAVLKQESAIAILTITRPRRSRPFGEKELAVLRPLMPHLKRALLLHQRLSVIEEQGRGLLEGINALAGGFVLVDPGGKVILMNRSAEAILAQNDGLSFVGQSLRAARPAENERLGEIVRAAATTGMIAAQAGGAISISRPSAGRPYSVLVCPLRLASNPVPGVQSPAAAVFITDPDDCRQPEEQVLRQLYGMTAAECRLAAVMQQGSTLQKAADVLGISRNTAHSQLKAVFSKTRTSRQAELMRVLGGTLVSLGRSAVKKKKD